MSEHRCTLARTIEAYGAVREAGLLNAKPANGGRFAHTPQEFEPLLAAGSEAVRWCTREILAWEHNQ